MSRDINLNAKEAKAVEKLREYTVQNLKEIIADDGDPFWYNVGFLTANKIGFDRAYSIALYIHYELLYWNLI